MQSNFHIWNLQCTTTIRDICGFAWFPGRIVKYKWSCFDTRTYVFGNYDKLALKRSRQNNGIVSSENHIVVPL